MYFANFCSGLLRSKIAASLILVVAASLQVMPAAAQSSVENNTEFSPPPTVADPKPGNNRSRVVTPVIPPSIVSFAKTSNQAGTVKVGDTITYSVTTIVSDAATRGDVTLTDTLGAGLDFGSVTDAGQYACNDSSPLVCTLPAGTTPGSYTVTYTAIVNASASGSVKNAVVGSGPDEPTCRVNCETTTPLEPASVTFEKVANSAGPVKIGDTIACRPARPLLARPAQGPPAQAAP